MNNIQDISNCFGCGLCAITCPKKLISIELNSDGFYEPRLNTQYKCTNCGLCIDVCSYSHHDLALKDSNVSSYAAWSNDYAVRRRCSSGGVGFEIGKKIIANGGKVCGVRYNVEKNQAEHYMAATDKELIPSIGSKYIQSYTVDGFSECISAIKESRKNGENGVFLVTGTPCQIDSFRRWTQKFKCEDTIVFLDFFCHGVPSKLVWDKYVEQTEKKVGKLTYVSWRNKFTGWHDSWAMAIDGEKKGCDPVKWHDSYNLLIREKKSYLNSRLSEGDVFYHLFLGNSCLGKQCYDRCRFKFDKSSADIRIGDAWGDTYKNDEDGVSVVLCFTEKGEKIIQTLSNCHIEEKKLDIVAEMQMRNQLKSPIERTLIITLLKTPISLYSISRINDGIRNVINRVKKILR